MEYWSVGFLALIFWRECFVASLLAIDHEWAEIASSLRPSQSGCVTINKSGNFPSLRVEILRYRSGQAPQSQRNKTEEVIGNN